MSIAYPTTFLLLLLALPLIWRIGWPRYAYRRRRDITSLLLRSAIVILIALALGGAQWVQAVEKQAVVFLVDVSDSTGTAARQAQLDYIQQAVADKPRDDEWAIVVFGANAAPERGFSTLDDVPDALRSQVVSGHTNIAEAIQTAIAIFPADARRRIILLSDGQQTLGDAEARARLAQAAGIEISYVTVQREQRADVRILDLEAPPRLIAGQEFDLTVSVEAQQITPARLALYANGSLIQEQDVTLQPGVTRYTLTQEGAETGFLNFSAIITPLDGEGDLFSQNNQLAAFTQVVGPPRVLVVAADAADVAQLIPALQTAGFAVDVREPQLIPPETAALADYRSVIVANVPATDFTRRQMERLDSYVTDLGGGLVFVGGPDSYGPGQYFDTPLAATLPVEMDIRDQQRLPQLTIAYLIDRSGSMAATDANGIPNIEIAKRAIDLSLEFLQPSDRAAIGTFDTGGAWVAPFQPVEDQRQLQRLVGTLRSGGGTDIGAGLALVERDITSEPSERKHMILLTDGGSNPRGLVERVRRLNVEQGVTVSVIAIGSLQPAFLQQMAEVGDGNFHAVTDVSEIPRIFTLETVLASRTFIEEGDFSARQTASSPIMDGITSLPNYFGYVATTARPLASVVLRGPEPFSDPLLVTWQRGLGRAVAFTSDATARWASPWVTWEGFSRFWGQAVAWSITQSAEDNLEARVVMQDETARLIVDARNPGGDFLNNLTLDASILDPTNAARSVRLQQVAPGRYEASFRPEAEGAYFLALTGSGEVGGAGVDFNAINGWVMSYSPEYAQVGADEALLARLAQLTGGQSLAETPEAAFLPAQEVRTAAQPLWPPLLLLALLLLPLDVAVRRLIITRSDVGRLRAWLDRGRVAAPDARMTTLMDARSRARQRTGAGGRDAAVDRLRQRQPEPDDGTPPPSGAPPPGAPPPGAPQTVPRATGETVGSLLERRRQRRDTEE